MLAAPDRGALYRLADANLTVALRHRSRDVDVLLEVLARPYSYEIPSEVRDRLPASPEVLDLGGNVGMFALFAFSRLPGARVTSVEPDPRNLRVLRSTRAANPGKYWTIIDAAAGVAGGTLMLEFFGDYAQTRVSESGTTAVRCLDVLPLMQTADLIKIDIEGSEWPVLADPRFAEVKAPMVIEWHEFGCRSLPALEAAERAFHDAGFVTRGEYGGLDTGQMWAWRS